MLIAQRKQRVYVQYTFSKQGNTGDFAGCVELEVYPWTSDLDVLEFVETRTDITSKPDFKLRGTVSRNNFEEFFVEGN